MSKRIRVEPNNNNNFNVAYMLKYILFLDKNIWNNVNDDIVEEAKFNTIIIVNY